MGSAEGSPLLLDTHYWIWMQSGDRIRLSPRAIRSIEAAARSGNLMISIISIWELGMLEAKGRIQLDRPCEQWVEQALATPGLTVAPLTPEIALDSSRLPGAFHGDPADRIIIATARRLGARLLTRDEKIREYAGRRHLSVL
jgi:PIN domain nuclease of toxin-antitoxin system